MERRRERENREGKERRRERRKEITAQQNLHLCHYVDYLIAAEKSGCSIILSAASESDT